MKKVNKNEIIKILENLSDSDIIHLSYEANPYGEAIYYMEEFDEICGGMTPSEIASKTFYGDFNPYHDYFTFDGYANFKSDYNAIDLVYTSDLADYIIDLYENGEKTDINEINEYFESLEEEEEE